MLVSWYFLFLGKCQFGSNRQRCVSSFWKINCAFYAFTFDLDSSFFLVDVNFVFY